MSTKPFKLGLTMAGAVSAGAYTSGVLTQIFESLDLWYNLRNKQITNIGDTIQLLSIPNGAGEGEVVTISIDDLPQHNIELVAISGTSAGGMCAALLPIVFSEDNIDRLRKTWVDDVDLKDMLDNSDIDDSTEKVYSLLNVKGIDRIRDEAKGFISSGEVATGQKWRPYLRDTIDIYLNFTCLEGIPYKLNYTDSHSSAAQVIRNFADYKRFTFVKPRVPLSAIPKDSTLLDPANKVKAGYNHEWDSLMECAVATGAFPFGLKPRTLTREKREYDFREFFLLSNLPTDGTFPKEPLYQPPSWPVGSPPSFAMEYIDGGLTNNEPFEQARRAVSSVTGTFRNPREGDKAAAGVIMIDPFPSDPIGIPGDGLKEIPELLPLLPYMIGAMKDNAQFDVDLLDSLQNPEVYSRYMISPIRYVDGKVTEAYPLASGLLGAFSGFFSVRFRDHDYRLARYNTSKFLMHYFALPLTNKEVFGDLENNLALVDTYKKLGWIFGKDKNGKVTHVDAAGAKLHMTLIPQMKFANRTHNSYWDKQPVWPMVSKDELDQLRTLAFARFKQLRRSMVGHMVSGGVFDGAADAGVGLVLGQEFFNGKWATLVENKFRGAGLIK